MVGVSEIVEGLRRRLGNVRELQDREIDPESHLHIDSPLIRYKPGFQGMRNVKVMVQAPVNSEFYVLGDSVTNQNGWVSQVVKYYRSR